MPTKNASASRGSKTRPTRVEKKQYVEESEGENELENEDDDEGAASGDENPMR